MNPNDAAAALSRLLDLAQRVRTAEVSPLWKRDPDAALQAHSDACLDVWRELDRLLDSRNAGRAALDAAGRAE
jgi:hypothetical protein